MLDSAACRAGTPLKLPRILPHLVYYEAPAGDQFPAEIPFPRRNRWAGREKPWEAGEKDGPEKSRVPCLGLVLLFWGAIVLGWSGVVLIQDLKDIFEGRPSISTKQILQSVPPSSDFFIPSPDPPQMRPHPSKFRAILEGDLISANFMAFSEFEREEEKTRGIEV